MPKFHHPRMVRDCRLPIIKYRFFPLLSRIDLTYYYYHHAWEVHRNLMEKNETEENEKMMLIIIIPNRH